MFRRRFWGRAYVAAWKVWLPVLALLFGLEASFDSWFWKIPKVSGTNADFGYQFLVDAHPLRETPAPETVRVLAFGSSVSGSFDPGQVDSLLVAADPETDFEVHRLLLPAAHPTDYALYFGNTDLAPPQVVVILFNLVDFLFSGSDRDANPTLRYILPPLVLREQRHEHMDVAGELDLLVAEASNLYRYRKPLRSALQDNVRAAARWLRSRKARQAYGIHPDGHTGRRFGFPVAAETPFDFRYFVDPEWLLQRGVVRVQVESAGRLLAERLERRSGWQTIQIPADATDGMLHVVLDSTWSPRVSGADDVRMLGVRLAPEVVAAVGSVGDAPFFYRPRESADIDTLLRMGGARGDEFLERWNETLGADTRFGHRFRVYRDAKRAVAERAFVADAEYEAVANLTAHFTGQGATVILVNTPESPLMLAEYGASEYYRGYREFFAQVAAEHPGASFADLSEVLPAEDFNDLHHPSFVGAIKLGPVYADVIRAALGRLPGQAIVEGH